MAFTGRKHTPETKAKMARARRTYWGSEAAADRRSKVTLEEVLLIHNLRCEGKTWKQVADSHDETMVAVKSRYYAALHSKDPKFDALREAHGKNAERVNREDD